MKYKCLCHFSPLTVESNHFVNQSPSDTSNTRYSIKVIIKERQITVLKVQIVSLVILSREYVLQTEAEDV